MHPHVAYRLYSHSAMVLRILLGVAILTLVLVSRAAAEWSEPLALDEDVGSYALAASPADASIVFAWRSGDGLVAQVRSADGTFGPIEPIAPGGSIRQIGIGAAGNAVFMWRGADGRLRTRVRAVTGVLSDTQIVSWGRGDEDRLAVARNGAAVFAWRRPVPGTSPVEYDIRIRARSADGVLSAARTVATGRIGELRLAVAPRGRAVVVWEQRDPVEGTRNIYARARSAVGGLLPVHRVSRGAAEPRVAVGPDGTATFAWTRRHGDFRVVETRTLTADGLSPVRVLSEIPEDAIVDVAFSPDVGADADGNVVFAWLRHHATPASDGYTAHVRARSSTGGLGPLQDFTFHDAGLGTFRTGRLAVGTNGDAVFAWRHGSRHIELGWRTAAGAAEHVHLVYLGVPQVAVAPDGTGVVLYAHSVASGGNELVAHFGP